MEKSPESILDKLIWIVLLSLVIITPLIFSSFNTELYEVPKMVLVYLGASLLLPLTLIRFIKQKTISWPKNPTAIFFLVFIASQIISTVFSIDKFTSIYGYPTRLNGGLLSQFAYFIIFTCAVINLSSKRALSLIIATVVTSFAVAVIGIASHFNLDISCLILSNTLSASCWQAEFNPTLRIFSTLGQPNWLAVYLVQTAPFALALLFFSTKRKARLILALISFCLILALIFTGSRSGFAGLIAAFLIFFALNGKKFIHKNRKLFIASTVIFLVLILTSGSLLFSRLTETVKRQKTVAGGTETGQIRLIVWQGAIEAFKKSPILGFGPETFAYAYSMYRPLAHNQTSEWNFFYNKAHNEFLNYLANLGALGTATYLALILSFTKSISNILKNKNQTASSLSKAAIAAIIGYHVAIFFGFSTVVSQLTSYTLIAAVFSLGQPGFYTKGLKIGNLMQKFLFLAVGLAGLWLITFTLRIFLSDIFFNRSQNLQSSKVIEASFNAIDTFPSQNPFYLSDFAQSNAGQAGNLEDQSAKDLFSKTASIMAMRAEAAAPNNFIILRRLINTYIILNNLSPQYQSQLTELELKLQKLAPTDPQTYLTSAKIEISLDNKAQANKFLGEALNLKPDYVEAIDLKNQLNQTIDNHQSTIDN